MRTIRNIMLFGAAAVFAFSSCSNDKEDIQGGFGDNPVKFKTSISRMKTRASETLWTDNDAIGVYMTNAGKLLTDETPLAQNKHYLTNTSGDFSYATDADAIYFPESANVDFIAYYPYTATINNFRYPVNIADQTDFEKIDVLYSDNATGLNRNSASVELDFEHAMSMLRFKITEESGNGMSDLAVTVSGLPTTADFELVDGTFSNPANVADLTMEITDRTGITYAQADAIVIPSTGISGVSVTFDVPSQGKKWITPLNDGNTLLGGTRHVYTVTLKTDGTVKVVNPKGDIEGWDDVDEGELNLYPDGTPGDGTQANPYSIDQLAGAVGQTAKWVEGYIVGSTVTLAAVGTPSTENILIAADPTETNESNCIPVDIAASAVKENLDIVANPELIGKKITLQGDIVNNKFGGILSLTNIIAQVGGVNVGGGGEPEQFFFEDFVLGAGDIPSGSRPKVGAYTNYLMGDPIVYSDSYGVADIRTTSTMDAAVWFPANNTAELLISNIDQLGSYTDIVLTYRLAPQNANTPGNCIAVYVDGTLNATQTDVNLATGNTYYEITLNLPDNISSLRFFSENGVNTGGVRLDDIKLVGVKQ